MRISDWSSDVCSSDLMAGEKTLLVDRYVDYTNLREKWLSKSPQLADIQFRDTVGVFRQDSLMATFYKGILNENIVIEKQIGRASCRDRVCQYVYISLVAVELQKNKQDNITIST